MHMNPPFELRSRRSGRCSVETVTHEQGPAANARSSQTRARGQSGNLGLVVIGQSQPECSRSPGDYIEEGGSAGRRGDILIDREARLGIEQILRKER